MFGRYIPARSVTYVQVRKVRYSPMQAMVWIRACWKGVSGETAKSIDRSGLGLGPQVFWEKAVMEH